MRTKPKRGRMAKGSADDASWGGGQKADAGKLRALILHQLENLMFIPLANGFRGD
ncbi:hypothetical protein [Paenibacillus ferrarius]|uniref:hypothetical protein n=1 Tax=Paenibacillus ferrarius TaxID=1469647 RepID=UPI003D265E33